MINRSLITCFAVLTLAAGRAEAVTIHDVIELSKAGLSDQVLVALIEVDRSVFSIDAATLKQLKNGGVSDAVIIAMIRSGRTPPTDIGVVKARVPLPPNCVKAEPVYWGFGGKLRPGSWEPPTTVVCR